MGLDSVAVKVKKVFLTTDNNQIKDNKTEKQKDYASNDSYHTTVSKIKSNKRNNNINNSNSINRNDNIQDTITPSPLPNPSENIPPQSINWRMEAGNNLNCGGLHDRRIDRG